MFLQLPQTIYRMIELKIPMEKFWYDFFFNKILLKKLMYVCNVLDSDLIS